MGNANICRPVADTRGPYEKMQICEDRIEEMKNDLIDIFPQTKLLPHAGYCGKAKEERIAL